ncbi:drug/metabolite transporter (DMT)-like permease [Comamonas odontotermitis]|uniref:Drug/metabolite transporter (DMT)-like permease n=1 Tax=Comamonas odontotermitis TaxID=379895 RepID=A0ABR6RAN5_9BURK|nr:aromatic amino acid DMT transporter YddG [Comamonas odontotermitis]MBB6576216.1 drug/metabolite transporter (DMT)-like permease [Comamonas odontotermitis]
MPSDASSPPAVSSYPRATLVGLSAVLCWSTSVGLFRSVAEHLGPIGGAASVFTASALLVTLRFGLPRVAQLRKMHPAYLWGCGLLFVLYEIALSLSLGFASNRTQTLELGMINYLWPSLTIVLATVFGLQRFRIGLVPGVLLAMAGIVLVLKGDSALSIASVWANVQSNPLAYGLAFAAAWLWPCYSVLSKRYAHGANALPAFLWAVAAVLWAKYAFSAENALQWSVPAVLQLGMLSGLTALGYSCWDYGIRHGNLTVMAVGSYFTPVLSALVGTVWLQVQPGWSFWQGVALVTLGSLICWWCTRQPRNKQ